MAMLSNAFCKTRGPVLIGFLLSFLLMGFASLEANALPPEWKASFARELRFGVQQAYPYVWGGRGMDKPVYDTKAKKMARGFDCFSYVWKSATDAGIFGVNIVRSRDAAEGKGGWTGKDITLDEVDDTDLGFVDWNDGPGYVEHMGAFGMDEKSGLMKFQHASTGRRHVLSDPFSMLEPLGKWRFRRLTIGDPK